MRSGLRARRLLATLARETRLDVLFFHTQVPAVLCTDWIRRTPSVVSLDATPIQFDELGASYNHETGPAWLEQIKWKLNVDCFEAARHIVAWSTWTKDGLVKDYGVNPDKISIIAPGVTVSEWVVPDRYEGEARKGPVKILFVGGNLERKGGSLLVQAFRALKSLNVELHLVTRDKLASEPGLFVYNDVKPNSDILKKMYRACDIFCLPTFGDSMPMVLSEAGAAGLPLVSTRLAAIPDIVIDGQTGLLVPVGDVAALTEALRTLVEQPQLRRSLGVQAAQYVTEHFDSVNRTQELLDLLKHVAGGSWPLACPVDGKSHG